MRGEREGFCLELPLEEAEVLYSLLRGEKIPDSMEISSIRKRLESYIFSVLSIEEMEILEARILRENETAANIKNGGLA